MVLRYRKYQEWRRKYWTVRFCREERDADPGGTGGGAVSRRPAEGRTQHAVQATASEWARIRELAAESGMELSRYIVHRATMPDPLPAGVLRRAVRELLLLSKLEERRMADMGLEERWTALGDAVDTWLDREAELDRLTDPGAAGRWRAVSASADPEGGPAPRP